MTRLVLVQRVFIYFFAALLFAGCAGKDDVAPADVEKQAFEDLRDEIREVVESPEREAEAIRLVDKLEKDLAALRVRVAERRKTARELNANYDTPRAEFEEYLERVDTEITEHKRWVSEIHRELLGSMEPNERSALAKTHTKAMKAAIATIQSI